MPPATKEQLQAKVTYKPTAKLEVFYTGGPARISKDGKILVCACQEEVKVSSWSSNPGSFLVFRRAGSPDSGRQSRALAYLNYIYMYVHI